MSFLPGMRPVPFIAAAAATPAAVTFVANYENASNLSAYTYTGASIGSAASDRYVIVSSIAAGGFSLHTGVTIGGVSATKIFEHSSVPVALYGLLVPTGTTANIVCSLAGLGGRHGLSVYAVTGLSSLTPVDTAQNSDTAGGTLNVDTLADGIVICGGWANLGPTMSWVGATKDHETLISSAVNHSTASVDGIITASPRSVSSSISGAGNAYTIAASLR